jgi:hypothetical protein
LDGGIATRGLLSRSIAAAFEGTDRKVLCCNVGVTNNGHSEPSPETVACNQDGYATPQRWEREMQPPSKKTHRQNANPMSLIRERERGLIRRERQEGFFPTVIGKECCSCMLSLNRLRQNVNPPKQR